MKFIKYMTKQNTNKSILITKPSLELGGVAAFVENITPFFLNNVIIFYRGKMPYKESKIKQLISRVKAPFRFIYCIIKNKPSHTIINTSLSLGGLLRDGIFVLLSKLFNIKTFLIVHGFQTKALKYKILLKYGYFQSNAMVVLAKEFKSHLKNSGYSKPIYTQWNPVSTDIINKFQNYTPSFNVTQRINVLFLARIIKAKGIITAIKAIEIVQEKYPEITLNIGGKGKDKEEAKNYVTKRNIKNIRFLGYLKGIYKINTLKNNDILLFPTEKEGLPINVLEAMTAGQVIITRPVGGLVDLYNSCSFGFSIESTQPEDFANAIVKVIENRESYRKVSEQNARFAQDNFHPKVITEGIEDILQSI